MVPSLQLALLLLYTVNLAWSLSVDQLAILESTIGENSCEFYNALETMMPCGEKGYVDDFAYKYCQAYLVAQGKFKDIKWQKGVRVCLQRTMLSKLQTFSQLSCLQVSTWGFNSHFDCYMHPVPNSPEINFCHLTSTDIIKIGWIAKNKVFKQEVINQFLKLTNECKRH